MKDSYFDIDRIIETRFATEQNIWDKLTVTFFNVNYCTIYELTNYTYCMFLVREVRS